MISIVVVCGCYNCACHAEKKYSGNPHHPNEGSGGSAGMIYQQYFFVFCLLSAHSSAKIDADVWLRGVLSCTSAGGPERGDAVGNAGRRERLVFETCSGSLFLGTFEAVDDVTVEVRKRGMFGHMLVESMLLPV